ncbi:unnamed protein product [Arabis nemorensis]|uniref:NYN domain-containing protein n=1 Tax=Arabis nemorensis TaxID=586526 RepID=A0A565BF08_9BRAS|nr:unnamed protein product [Arabis nemorensis]
MNADFADAEGSFMIEEEDLSMIKDRSKVEALSKPKDFRMRADYQSDPEDYSDIEELVFRGPQTRLYWNLEDYPIPANANLVDIRRKIKLAFHRLGLHGFLIIHTYGGKLTYTELELYNAHIIDTPSPPPKGWSIAGQICVDILSFGHFWETRTSVYVVLARQDPASELNRVLERMQSSYQQTVLTIEPHDGLFDSADSVLERTLFVGGGKTRPKTYFSKRIKPVNVLEAGVFWDARDCPFPVSWSADSIYLRIKSALTRKHGVSDNMAIWAYVDEKKESFVQKSERIDFIPAVDSPAARHGRMLNDILFWLIQHPRHAHLIVAGKINTEMYNVIGTLLERGCCSLILRPANDTVPEFRDWPAYLLDQGVYGFGCDDDHESGSGSESPKHKKPKAGD